MWQPIETAPQDGTEILVYYKTGYANGKGCSVVSCRKDALRYNMGWTVTAVGGHDCEQDFYDKDVTHWMPIPELPKD